MGLGDEIMVSGRARVLQQTDPRKCRVTFQGKPRWSPIWDGNPRMARLEEQGDFQEIAARDAHNNRPYHTSKTTERWTYDLAFRPDIGELYFTNAEQTFGGRYAGRVILEPHIKPGASPNKQWGWERWELLAGLLHHVGLEAHQLGPIGTRLLQHVRLIVTPTFRHACAVLAGARIAMLPEGGLHHAAAALNVRAVVIFGGFTPVELTGYPMHRNLGASLGEACGARYPCEHCAGAMASITPQQVFNETMDIIHA
jgi:ADP-heptose:LPS heptosyltransferase